MNPETDRFADKALNNRQVTHLDSLIEFYQLCARADGNSEKTILLTTTALRLLTNYLRENGLSTDALRIGPTEIRKFILHLQSVPRFSSHPFAKQQEQPLSGQSVNCYLRAIRAAFNRWVSEGLLDSSPFSKIKIPKAPKKVIPTFSEDQLRALFAVIDTSTTEGFRDYTLFSTYLDTACRLTEITKLRIDDINFETTSLRVVGKGNRERVVPFCVDVKKALWKYIHFYRPSSATTCCDYVFLTREGTMLTKNRVEIRMKHYGEKAGIRGVRCSPHTLRHNACLLWLRTGGDVYSLQALTGHSSLEVLRSYVNLTQSDIKRAHQRHSPIDNLGLSMPKKHPPNNRIRR